MDTIAAVATARQPSAIGIVRLSGEDTLRVVSRLFSPHSGRAAASLPPRTMTYGTVLDEDGRVLDYALLVLFPEGQSYTGEQSAEIHCHGSPVVLDAVLRAAFRAGARQAQAGEFTRRAFLNGKMDLTQAEAVIDLIDAETEAMARSAITHLGGALQARAETVYQALLSLSSRCYALIDYPEEGLSPVERTELSGVLEGAREELERLLASERRGHLLKSGVLTAILGPPNAGKSSLLNRLLGYDRAIVSTVPGTTRDTIEERAVLGGVLLRLVDTAGVRESGDAIEALGVSRSRQAAQRADLILALLDGSQPLSDEGRGVLDLAQRSGCGWILLLTKRDLPQRLDPAALPLPSPPLAVLSVSSLSGEGLPALEQAVARAFPPERARDAVLLTNARQADAVRRALQSVRAAGEALNSGLPEDVVLSEAEAAMNALGELTGRTAKDDIVSAIFSRFCVGK